MKLNALGIWLGFQGFTAMKREGISRYVLYLTKYLIKNYKINCELWCYAINKAEVESLFIDLLNDEQYNKYISIITEKEFSNEDSFSRFNMFRESWHINSFLFEKTGNVSGRSPYKKYSASIRLMIKQSKSISFLLTVVDYLLIVILFGKGSFDKLISIIIKKKRYENPKRDTEQLVQKANTHSKADCFIIPVFLLTNALCINKPKLISLHDLHLYDFYDLFVEEWGKVNTDNWLASFDNSVSQISEYLKTDKIFFVSNCDYVRRNHTLKYIENVREELTDYVYLPVIIPEDIEKRIISEMALRDKFKIDCDYIFFPTQIRPYKNVITLLRSLNILVKKYINIKLVFTGKISDSKLADKFVKDNNLSDYIIQTGDVPEEDLYSLHKYAAATVVTTLFEGGIPWPALEALYMDTPAIVSKIPMVVERIESVGFNADNCGLRFFEPLDYEVLSKEIEYAISNRDEIVRGQREIKQALLSYNWDDVSRKYYNIITTKLLNNL